MPIQIEPMAPSDLENFNRLIWASAKDEIMGIMYPNGMTEETITWLASSDRDQLQAQPERIQYLKAIDTDLPDDDALGKMIAGAKYRVYPRDVTQEEKDAERAEGKNRGFPPGANEEFLKAFFAELGRCDGEIVGNKAVVTLGLLFTRPDHWRRGAGGLLVGRVCQVADELGIRAFLEASPMGRPLYERMGFEIVEPVRIDFRDWGYKNELRHYCMVRPAKKKAVDGASQ